MNSHYISNKIQSFYHNLETSLLDIWISFWPHFLSFLPHSFHSGLRALSQSENIASTLLPWGIVFAVLWAWTVSICPPSTLLWLSLYSWISVQMSPFKEALSIILSKIAPLTTLLIPIFIFRSIYSYLASSYIFVCLLLFSPLECKFHCCKHIIELQTEPRMSYS